jgi:primosomal protein N' (replication factor Y)
MVRQAHQSSVKSVDSSCVMRYAEVAVDAPAGRERTFTYSIPEGMSVRPGHLVRVPFGPRTLQGVVFSLSPTSQVPKIRDILAVIGAEPVLTESQLGLARWLSGYYICTLFEAAALMLPPGGHARSRTYLALSPDFVGVEGLSLTPLQRRVLEYIGSRGAVEQEHLMRVLRLSAPYTIKRLVDRGVLVRSSRWSRPAVGPKRRDYLRPVPDANGSVSDAGLHPRHAALLARLAEGREPLELAEARKEYGASVVNALLSRGWARTESVVEERDPLAGREFPPAHPVALTPRQAAVAAEIRATLENAEAEPRAFLVQGVTGSGKTEIYLDAVSRCLELGRQAIVLVPEIALTHQTIERFASRFQRQVAVLHSGLSAGERFDQWWKVKQGEYGVVIGSRGAIFAPLPDLGLIVMDEEHEWTYKQHDASPRYHARDVALKLSELTGAVVVLGSASPDVATYYRGLHKELRILTLPRRVGTRDWGLGAGDGGRGNPQSLVPSPQSLASVEIVDMRLELREGNRGIFSRALTSAMEECLDEGGQMVLFLNRRGTSSFMQCRSCGFGLRCKRCDIALTYHKQIDRLVCHYCAYRRIAPAKCPKCLSFNMRFHGVGTQSVADEVRQRFPDATVIRWDRDVAGGPRAYEELLERFRSGEAQVLVGTQMIAKGLHFPAVTLVGVVSADVGLHVPDYRAGERTFQLLCQVAGRAGRGPSGGRVIVQTYQPENYAVRAAASQDYQAFYTREMAFRREQANPPYSKLIRLLYAHTNLALCEREAKRLAELLRQRRDAEGYSNVELLGPTPAYPARLKGQYRWHLVLRGPEPRVLLDKVTIPSGWNVDVDPVSLT